MSARTRIRMRLISAAALLLFAAACASQAVREAGPPVCTGLEVKTWGATWCPGCQQLEKQVQEHQLEASRGGKACYPDEIRAMRDGRAYVARYVHLDTTGRTDEERLASGQLTHVIPEAQVWTAPTGARAGTRVACKAYVPTVGEVQSLILSAYDRSLTASARISTVACPRD